MGSRARADGRRLSYIGGSVIRLDENKHVFLPRLGRVPAYVQLCRTFHVINTHSTFGIYALLFF